ncbi:AMP-binding protein [Thermocrinis sp.]
MQIDLENKLVIPLPKDFRKTALIHRDREITYSELIEKTKEYANYMNIMPGDRVVIFSENRPEWVYALFALWQRGGIGVPVDFMSSSRELEYILRETEPSVVVCSDATEETLREALSSTELSPTVLNLDRPFLLKPIEHVMSRSFHDTALILYTSGTTGEPKGVMLSFKNIISNILGVERLKVASKEDSTLAILPFHHSYPLLASLLLPIYLGATIVFIERLSSEALMQTLQKHPITILIGVPRLYQLLEQRIKERIEKKLLAKVLFKLSFLMNRRLRRLVFKKVHQVFGGRLRHMVSGGAKLPVETAKFFDRLGFLVLEGYGLTETSPIVSFNPPNRVKLGSVGLPIEGVQVKIEDGEVMVKGVNVMQGYYKKEEETKRAFKNGWLLTGDLGYLDKEGYLYITGRKKEILVLAGGKNVNPEELELLIQKRDPIVKEVCVLELEGKLHALIHPDFERAKNMKISNITEYIKWEVMDRVNRSLPEWKRITGFRITTKELPKTRLGKIRRFLIPDIYRRLEEYEEKKEEVFLEEEGRLIASFLSSLSGREVKGYEHIELDLGLDSLAKVELLAFIESSFGVSLKEEDLSLYPTVKELESLVRERKQKTQWEEVDWEKILKSAKPYTTSHHRSVFLAGLSLIKLFFKLYNRLEVYGLENLPKPPFIIAPNHASYLDGFLIASSLPYSLAERTYFLGDEKYFEHPITATFGKLAHVVPINSQRKVKESMEKVSWLLRTEKVVVIFPEGARTRDGNLLPFKKGFAVLSSVLNIPVVPTAIVGSYQSMSLRDKFPKPNKIKVIFGKPIYPNGKSLEDIVKETRDHLEELLTLPESPPFHPSQP